LTKHTQSIQKLSKENTATTTRPTKKTVTSLVFHQPRLKQEIPQWRSFAGQLLLPSDFDFAIGNKPPCQGKGCFDKNTLLPNLNSKRYAFQCFLSKGAACAPYVGRDFRISNLFYHFLVFFSWKKATLVGPSLANHLSTPALRSFSCTVSPLCRTTTMLVRPWVKLFLAMLYS